MALTLTEPDGWAYYSKSPLVYTAAETDGSVRTIKWTINLRRSQTGSVFESIVLSTVVNNFDKVHLDVAATIRGAVKDTGIAYRTQSTLQYPQVNYPHHMSKSGVYWVDMQLVSQNANGDTLDTASSSTNRMIMDGYIEGVTSLNYKDQSVNITNADTQGFLTDRDMSVNTYYFNRTIDTLPSLSIIRLREYDTSDPDNPNVYVAVNTDDGNSTFYMTDGDLEWTTEAWSNRLMWRPNINNAAIYAEKNTGTYSIGDSWNRITTYAYMSDSRRTCAVVINNICSHNSKTKPLHLMWQNTKGGVDDVVFEGHTETSQSTKEKRYQIAPYSTYTTTPEPNVGGASARYYAETEQTIRCSSVTLTADDRRILQYAYKSPRVWYRIVDDHTNWEECTLQGSYQFETAKSRVREVTVTLKPTKRVIC